LSTPSATLAAARVTAASSGYAIAIRSLICFLLVHYASMT
jgi:hypothetical protein